MMEAWVFVFAVCVTGVLTCAPPGAQPKTMSERLAMSEAVLYANVTSITTAPLSDKDISIDVLCILKNNIGISVNNSIVIEERTNACPTNQLDVGTAYIMQVINKTGGGFEFYNYNSQLATYNADQQNLETVANLNGFENPTVPAGGDTSQCPRRQTYTTTSSQKQGSQPGTTESGNGSGASAIEKGMLLALIILTVLLN